MTVTRASWISAALLAATAAIGAWAWFALPPGAGVATHYLGLDGQRHEGVSRSALWVIPLAGVVVTASLTLGPRLTGRRVEAFAPELYSALVIAITGLLLVVEAALVARAFDAGFNVMRPVAIATGALLIAVGNYLGKTRQNPIVGLKTPWTLADPRVWDKTHRIGGWAMVLGGVVLVGLGLALRDGEALGLAIGACTAIPILAAAAWSSQLHRRG